MEFTNEFTVPSDIETTFATLTDLEKVAPCLPGATLEEVDGDAYTGRVKVKVGPAQVTYRGTARMVEADAETKRGRIEARVALRKYLGKRFRTPFFICLLT